MMVGRLLSFLDGLFSRAMLNFQGVGQLKTCFFRHSEQLLFHSGYEEETSVEISRAIEAGGM